MRPVSVHAWTETPLRRFVADACVRYAVLLHPSGLVLGQHGFTQMVDVMAACALAAAIRASAAALGNELKCAGRPFTDLYHGGGERHIYLAEAATSRGPYVLLTVFGSESSLGLVKLYFDAFRAELARAAPPVEQSVPLAGADFEEELQRGLAAVFDWGPARLSAGGRG